MKNMMTWTMLHARWLTTHWMGMATETYPGKNLPSKALVRLQPDGRVLVRSGGQEIGTGMDAIITQITADVLGTSPDLVDARLGDTNYPEASISAGSMSTASCRAAGRPASPAKIYLGSSVKLRPSGRRY
jgi:xanthine dehydrogenase YagR molybdenum-binding subunit